ncbi:MAG: winged helix DNA-binding domain-containing protein [Geodermatophilaceae bacterium]|nr:winged helix DNA-binding domain-containing protein [Geodermatophilaceae bacterium]
MSLTARQLNRATLERQLLLHRESIGVVDAAHRIVALQAQEAASPYLAMWNRLARFDPIELDAAFTDHSLVKASLMRITLHAVHAEDYPAFHNAMVSSLRASRLYDRRYKSTGLTVADADAFLPHLLAFAAQPRTKTEFEALIETRLGLPQPRMWWAQRTFAPLMHCVSGGPWSFGPRPAYVAARPEPLQDDRDESIQWLALRYLQAFGPATAHDFAQFTLLTRAVARQAMKALTVVGTVHKLEGPDGIELFDVPGACLPDEDTPAPPRLMAMWDLVLLAHADRSRVIPPDYRKLVTRVNGDVLPTLLVDGYVAGVWRPVGAGIEATAFHRLSEQAWDGLAAEARALVAFLADRDPTVYRRYSHWWAKLPSAEVRVLPG